MRADRILVVMNGEIIEQGSHFDLIHARGKYHDLWSKQILVKPGGNERSRSKSPKKRDADLINDISPTRRTVDLAKALETTEHQEPQDKEEQKVSDQQKPGADQKREVCDAP
jgi:ABC-type dipeptide/oligopeptide/nickel transport system ATPase component